MKAAKLIVLLSGVLGILAFFVPMAKFSHDGKEYAISAYQLFTGVSELESKVDSTQKIEGLTDQQLQDTKKDVYETLSEIKGIVLVCFLPGVILALVGLLAVVRRRYGRLGGLLAIVLGLVSFLVFMGLSTGAEEAGDGASKGPAMYLLAATGLLAMAGGMLVLVKPDRGPDAKA